MGINKNVHDVEVALGFSDDTEVVEEESSLNADILNHKLYAIHIKKANDALSDTNPHICIGWSNLGDLSSVESKE